MKKLVKLEEFLISHKMSFERKSNTLIWTPNLIISSVVNDSQFAVIVSTDEAEQEFIDFLKEFLTNKNSFRNLFRKKS